MAVVFDNDTKERVRLAINIVDLIGSYADVRRQGRGFVARCPFHDDRRPSLQINPERQVWKCYVCDVGGDVFSFIMQKEGVTFPEALRLLADRAGIVIEERKGSRKEDVDAKRNLYKVMQWAVAEYHQCFLNSPEASEARRYIEDRGIDRRSIERFQIGFAPESWSWIIDRGVSASIGTDALESVGLLTKNERGSRYDRFRNRVLFPIRDPQSRPIAIGGRVLPGAPADSAKYINCSETALYHKNQQLYGLDLAREKMAKTRQAIVMEGYTDVIMAFQHGIDNAVACCGTALGENHIQLLKRYCDSVVLLLDGDEAGQRRTAEILELFLAQQLDLRILTLPDALDPCDFLVQQGGDALQSLIAGAIDALEYKIRTVCKGFDPLLDTHRATTALESVLQSIARIPNASATEVTRLRQDQILARLSRQFGIGQVEIKSRLDAIRANAARRQQFRQQLAAESNRPTLGNDAVAEPVAPVADRIRYGELRPIEAELFEIMVLHPDLAPMAIERFPPEHLLSGTAKRVFAMYVELELAGTPLDFQSVLSATMDPQLQSVMVSIEEHASLKAAKSLLSAEERLHTLCERWAVQDDIAYRKSQIRSLEQKTLDAQSEVDLLSSVLNQARIRHGIVPAEE
ncbi:MAG: DNA primase [Pirellula sp.]|nr:DNA primase [Pirellula sp.]